MCTTIRFQVYFWKQWAEITKSAFETKYDKDNFRYSKFETLLTAHNWHWVSSMGTNVKINIFETYPVTSANVDEKTIHYIVLSMTTSTTIITYFYSKIRSVWGRSFFNKNLYHLHTNSTYHEIKFLSFNTAFVTFQVIENNQEYKPKLNFIIIEL